MSASEDIRNLFGKFDGQSKQYQEVARDDQASQSRARWPLLSSLALDDAALVPDVAETAHAQPTLREAQTQASTQHASAQHASTQGDGVTPVVDEPTSPTSRFAPPRAPGPRPAALPFVREAAPAFRVHTGPSEAAADFPPVVTPQTSKRHSPLAQDFAPPVVPVNQFKPSAAPITGVEAEVGNRAMFARMSTSALAVAPTSTPTSASTSTSTSASMPTSRFSAASAATPQPTSTSAASIPSGSILGKLFAQAPAATPEPVVEPASRSRDLRAVFGRLGGGALRGEQGGGE